MGSIASGAPDPLEGGDGGGHLAPDVARSAGDHPSPLRPAGLYGDNCSQAQLRRLDIVASGGLRSSEVAVWRDNTTSFHGAEIRRQRGSGRWSTEELNFAEIRFADIRASRSQHAARFAAGTENDPPVRFTVAQPTRGRGGAAEGVRGAARGGLRGGEAQAWQNHGPSNGGNFPRSQEGLQARSILGISGGFKI